jgi:hypothetical protein
LKFVWFFSHGVKVVNVRLVCETQTRVSLTFTVMLRAAPEASPCLQGTTPTQVCIIKSCAFYMGMLR